MQKNSYRFIRLSSQLLICVSIALTALFNTACSSTPSASKTDEQNQSADAQKPAIQTEEVRYQSGRTEMVGYVAYPATKEKRPVVLVVHEWWGQTEYPRKRADMLAELGYVAMAIDLYGNGKTADHPKTAGEFAKAISSKPDQLKKRFEAALEAVKKIPQADTENLAVVGYCFGGGVALDMARAGLDLDGVVSLHGALATSKPAKKGNVKAKVLVFNGAADPMVKSSDVESFKNEMTQAGADFEVINFDGVKHAFTNPNATDLGEKFELPLEYNADADQKSWERLKEFLESIFSAKS